MILQKWDYNTRSYKDYEVPDSWNILLYTEDMKTKVNCPHCGKEFTYGYSHTSMEIHNYCGLGYGVCELCHSKEMERYKNTLDKN